MTKEEITKYGSMMTDLWNFQKKHWHVEDWESLLEEKDMLVEKHHDDYFNQLILVCINYMEHINDNRKSIGILDDTYKNLKNWKYTETL